MLVFACIWQWDYYTCYERTGTINATNDVNLRRSYGVNNTYFLVAIIDLDWYYTAISIISSLYFWFNLHRVLFSTEQIKINVCVRMLLRTYAVVVVVVVLLKSENSTFYIQRMDVKLLSIIFLLNSVEYLICRYNIIPKTFNNIRTHIDNRLHYKTTCILA